MNGSRWFERPRVLAGLALAFAIVPAWVAVATFREARQHDERRFASAAELLTERLRENSGHHFYFLAQLRARARSLPDDTLRSWPVEIPGFAWKERVPHLMAYGYAELQDGRLVLRWRSDARTPVAEAGDDLAADPRVAALLRRPPPTNPSDSIGCLTDRHRFLALHAVPGTGPGNPTRGYLAGWIDLDALCRDESATLVRDHVLAARPLAPDDELPKDATRATLRDDGGASWDAAILRGPAFNQSAGPLPWVAVIAAGLSAVPMLVLSVLAGRAAKLRGDLAAEREQLRQQRFFTQSVSHEFRTPLSIILSGADLLGSYGDQIDEPRRRQVLDEIQSHTRQMNDMIERVLLLGRIESGREQPKRVPVNLAAFCGESARRARAATRDRCPIAVDAPDATATTDPAWLGSILDNLLSNAVKYSPPGATVRVEARLTGDGLAITVRDEGIGIPGEDLDRAGEMFFRAGNVGEAPGTGLGLAIARRCAALLGGTLKLESPEGRGTLATLTLPLPAAS